MQVRSADEVFDLLAKANSARAVAETEMNDRYEEAASALKLGSADDGGATGRRGVIVCSVCGFEEVPA